MAAQRACEVYVELAITELLRARPLAAAASLFVYVADAWNTSA